MSSFRIHSSHAMICQETRMYESLGDAEGRHDRYEFRVLALVCDSLAANGRLFRLHAPDEHASEVYKVPNPDGRRIFSCLTHLTWS